MSDTGHTPGLCPQRNFERITERCAASHTVNFGGRIRSGWLALLAGTVLMGACSSKPPVPDWQMTAHASTDKAMSAYLTGQSRVESQEWERARSAIASTGRADLLARTELLRCAGQSASLALAGPCGGFEALREDAAPAELAYAAFLQGKPLSPEQIALLPAAQQSVAQSLNGAPSAADAAAVLAKIEDPLSRLVGASALFKSGGATVSVVALAVDTASDQGWRRPLIAWLNVQADQAKAAGDAATEARVRRRLSLIAP
jgi:hypothetical protein